MLMSPDIIISPDISFSFSSYIILLFVFSNSIIRYIHSYDYMTPEEDLKDTEGTFNQLDLINMYRTLNNSKVNILFKYTWNIHQDKSYSRPQNKSLQIYKDQNNTKHVL